MKTIFLHIIFIFCILSSFGQTHHFKFELKDKSILNELTKIISIDKVEKNTVQAYANEKEYKDFLKYNFPITNLPLNDSKGKSLTMAQNISDMQTWDKYPTFELYQEILYKYAEDFPDICIIDTIGVSENGKYVLVLRITDNPTDNENEPEVFLTGQMHGDEIVTYILFLRLIDYMLNNYGTDSEITYLINNVDIWINPLSNPDGTYKGGNNTVTGAARYNYNNVDLNRSFPTPLLTNPPYLNEAEVQMMMNFADKRNFVLSVNSHSGAELVNYPWDTWKSYENKHPDHTWFDQISYNYANTVHENAPPDYLRGEGDGVTHGGDWYVVHGSRQDFMLYSKNCREITLELSGNKMLDAELLPDYWIYNKDAMLGYIKESLYGIRGVVTDIAGNPLNAVITVNNHDKDNSEIKTDPVTGNYHRMIDDGTYTLTFSSSGYTDIEINNVSVTDNEITIVDVFFEATQVQTDISGTVTEYETGEAIADADVNISNNIQSYSVSTDNSGKYSAENVPAGTYKFIVSKENYQTSSYYETVSSNQNTFNHVLSQINYTVNIVVSESSEFIENATVNLTGFTEQTTNESGQVQFRNIKATSSSELNLAVAAERYEDYNSTINITSDTTIYIDLIPENYNFTFPNPNTGNFTVRHKEIIHKIEIFNISGQIVLSKISDEYEIEITNLNQGVYIILIYAESNIEKKLMIVSNGK